MPPSEDSHVLWLVVVFYYYLETRREFHHFCRERILHLANRFISKTKRMPLFSHLEETVYCQEPSTFVDPTAPNYVYLLQKSMYGISSLELVLRRGHLHHQFHCFQVGCVSLCLHRWIPYHLPTALLRQWHHPHGVILGTAHAYH